MTAEYFRVPLSAFTVAHARGVRVEVTARIVDHGCFDDIEEVRVSCFVRQLSADKLVDLIRAYFIFRRVPCQKMNGGKTLFLELDRADVCSSGSQQTFTADDVEEVP